MKRTEQDIYEQRDIFGNSGVDHFEWYEMPEFRQTEYNPYHELVIHFRSKEDYEKFVELIDQPNLLNEIKRKRQTWYPKLDTKRNSALRYISKDDYDPEIHEIVTPSRETILL